MTRTTTAHLFQSVNGVAEAPHQFQFDAMGPDEGTAMGAVMSQTTDVVMGRKLWQEWSAYWPDNTGDPFANFINPVRKHVITSTLEDDLGWNSTRVTGDPAAYLSELRQDDGGGISVVGGIETVRSLFLAGAIDELALTIHPAVSDDGRRLFDDSVPLTRLSLVRGQVTPAGNAMMVYALRDD